MCCNQLEVESHPVELKFNFNPKCLKGYKESKYKVRPDITFDRPETIKRCVDMDEEV